MSIDTLISNPVIINELKTVFGGSTGGITTINNTDTNLAISTIGSISTINFENDLTVSNEKLTGTLNLTGIVQLNGLSGLAGQVLTSGGGGAMSWSNVNVGGNVSYVNNFSGQQTVQSGATIIAVTQSQTGLTIGARSIFIVNFSYTQTSGSGTNIAQFLVDGVPITSETSANSAPTHQVIKSGFFTFTNTATTHLFEIVVGGIGGVNVFAVDSLTDYFSFLILQVV